METGVKNIASQRAGEQLSLVPEVKESPVGFFSRLSPKNIRLGVASLALTTGAVAGVGVGIYEARSTQTQLLPGIEADISPTMSHGVTIEAGPLGRLYLPAVHSNLPVLGEVSGNVSLKNLNLSSQNVNELAASIDNPKQILEKPLKEKMLDHLESDGLNGLMVGVFGALLLVGADSLRQRRRQNDLKKEIDCLKTFSPYVNPKVMGLMTETLIGTKESIRRDYGQRNRRIAVAAGIGALLVAVPTAYHFEPSNSSHVTFDAIDPSLTQGISYLNGAEVTADSPLEQIINVGLPAVLDLKQSIDQSYADVLPGLNQAIRKFKNSPLNAKWLDNPNLLMALDNSNLHCDFPYETTVLPALTSALTPSIIINSGDTMISSDTQPFEGQCVSIQAPALQSAVDASGKQIYEVTIKGEDDSETTVQLQRSLTIKGPDGKPYNPIVPLDSFNGYTARVDGLNFVGGPDPRQHISGEPMQVDGKPADLLLQSQALEQSGQSLAKVACNLFNKQANPPIMIVHNAQQASTALQDGCVSAVLSSEGDWHSGVTVTSSGSGAPVAQLIEGTSSGADYNGFAPYAKRAYNAPSTILFINRQTNRVVASSQLVISTSGQTNISKIKPVGS